MKEQPPPNHNAVVAKDNRLVEQVAKYELSELRLIAYCLAHYDSRKPENRAFEAKVTDLAEIFKIQDSSAYTVIRRTMLNLGRKPLQFTAEDGSYKMRQWFSGLDYNPGTGRFTFILNSDITPFLLELEGMFTCYRLRDVYQFKAASTWKMYELLKRWVAKGSWEVELDELRRLMRIEGSYPRWSDLSVRIIKPAINEINNVSDLNVTYSLKKWKRTITGLIFSIKRKTSVITTTLDQNETLEKALIRQGINQKTAKEYSEKAVEQGKAEIIMGKLPNIIERAQAKGSDRQRYLLGTIKKEIGEPAEARLGQTVETHVPYYQESLDCWQEKRRTREKCKVRIRGEAGQRKKCQICLEKLNPDDGWGI